MNESDTAQRIAETALKILEEDGPQSVSMRRIAESVGITPMAIYHHFSSRESLLRDITDREFERLAAHMDEHPVQGRGASRLIHAVELYIDYALQRPAVFDYVFSQRRVDARRFPDDFRARRSPTMNRLADLVADAMESGDIRNDDVWEVALELWAHAHGYVQLYRAGRLGMSEQDFRSLCRRSLRRLLRGLKP